MPKWVERWVKRIEDKFPDCAVRCSYDKISFAYLISIFYPKERAWVEEGNWYSWGVLLNASLSPAVWQNRKAFRDECDHILQHGINRCKG